MSAPKPPALEWSLPPASDGPSDAQEASTAPGQDGSTPEAVPLAVEAPQEEWLVERIFSPGEVHLIGGAPGAGKTAWEVWLRSHIERGLPFLGHATHRPPAWHTIIFDRSSRDRRYWWQQGGIVDPVYYCLTEDGELTLGQIAKMTRASLFALVERLIREVWQLPRGSVVTVDVANMLAADSRSSYLAAWTSGVQLGRLAEECGITILALMHGAKQVGDNAARYVRPTDRMIAGTGFLGAVGTRAYLMSLKESGDHGWQDFGWEPHHHRPQEFRFQRTENGLFAPWHSRERDTETETRDAKDLGPEDLLIFFPVDGDGYLSTGDAIKQFQTKHGVPPHKRTLERWIEKLDVRGLLVPYRDKDGREIQGKWVRPKGD